MPQQVDNYWISFSIKDELTRCFKILSWYPSVKKVGKAMKVIAKFVMFAYNKNISDSDIDEFRLVGFGATPCHLTRCPQLIYGDGVFTKVIIIFNGNSTVIQLQEFVGAKIVYILIFIVL